MARAVHSEAQQLRTACQELIIFSDVEITLLLTGEGSIRQILSSRRGAYGDGGRASFVVGLQHSGRDRSGDRVAGEQRGDGGRHLIGCRIGCLICCLGENSELRLDRALETVDRHKVGVCSRGDVESVRHRQSGQRQPRQGLALPADFRKTEPLVGEGTNIRRGHRS